MMYDLSHITAPKVPPPPVEWNRKIIATACDVVGTSLKTLRADVAVIDAELAEKWYASGETAYELYDTREYLISMLHCWRFGGTSSCSSNMTRRFIQWLSQRQLKPTSFIDYHGGLGLTSAQFAMSFPDAKVTYHTVVEKHAEIGREVFKRLGVPQVRIVHELESAEVLVAQETMEHFPDPCTEIVSVFDKVKPQYYLDGSSFTIDACGHFKHNHRVSKKFNQTVNSLGYERWWKVEGSPSPFNGKPAIWLKVEGN